MISSILFTTIVGVIGVGDLGGEDGCETRGEIGFETLSGEGGCDV
jgi:hypothetical protein